MAKRRRVKEPNINYDGRAHVDSHGPHDPQRGCLHSTESGDWVGTKDLEGVALFWERQDRGFGSHIGVDKTGKSARYVNDDEVAWALGGLNTGTLQVEQIAFARFSRATWLARPRQLHKVARWIAYYNKKHGVPIRRARYMPELQSMGRGWFQHRHWSRVSDKSDHTDCGIAYPFWPVLALARAYRKTGWYGPPNAG